MPLRWLPHPKPSQSPLAPESPRVILAAPGSVNPDQRLTSVLAASSLLAVAWPVQASLPRAAASTITVTNLNPSGPGSLPQAILQANANPGPDIITFSPSVSGTITLTSPVHITDTVIIQGPGPGKLSVSGGHTNAVFYLTHLGGDPITATISGLTIRDGNTTGGGGGGIYSQGVDLTLDQVDLLNNTASGRGGAIDFGVNSFNIGLTIRNSLISGNVGGVGGGVYVKTAPAGVTIENTQVLSNTALGKAGGGGVYLYVPTNVLIQDSSLVSNTASLGDGGGLKLGTTNGGATTIRRALISGNSAVKGGGVEFYNPANDTLIEDTTISGNAASQRGGGLDFEKSLGGAHTILRTTISGNTADFGGGIYLDRPANLVTIEDSTVSGNSAANIGGGIYLNQYPQAALQNSTVVSNSAGTAGGGIQVYRGVFPITDTIVAHNSAPTDKDITGTFELRYDLVQITGTAAITNNGGNLFGLDPLLGPLANHGGPTQTQFPAHNSPVINAGDPAFAEPPDTDQRGDPRVSGGRVDIGAVETQELFLPLVRR